MEISSGDFIIHLDDDDRLAEDAIATLLPILQADPDIDVVAYDQECNLQLENETATFRVRTSINFDNETARKGDDGKWVDIKRKPWHWCAWRASLARQFNFIGRVDEDWQWLKQVLPKVKHQYKLHKVLHKYFFNKNSSLCLEDPK